jgi:hypothetical protein
MVGELQIEERYISNLWRAISKVQMEASSRNAEERLKPSTQFQLHCLGRSSHFSLAHASFTWNWAQFL